MLFVDVIFVVCSLQMSQLPRDSYCTLSEGVSEGGLPP